MSLLILLRKNGILARHDTTTSIFRYSGFAVAGVALCRTASNERGLDDSLLVLWQLLIVHVRSQSQFDATLP